MLIFVGYFWVVNLYGFNCDIYYCEEIFFKNLRYYQNIYFIIFFVMNFVIFFLIMVVFYLLIFKKIREYIFVLKRVRDESC